MAPDPSAAEALKGLREIPLPVPVSWMPQTIGWVGVAVIVAGVLGWAAWRWRRRWLADRYRRAALADLDAIERSLDAAPGPTDLAALPALVKRTVLGFAPREAVARLTDREWLAFLDRTYPPGGFATGPGRVLPTLAYAPAGSVDAPALRDLIALVRRWIVGHHAVV